MHITIHSPLNPWILTVLPENFLSYWSCYSYGSLTIILLNLFVIDLFLITAPQLSEHCWSLFELSLQSSFMCWGFVELLPALFEEHAFAWEASRQCVYHSGLTILNTSLFPSTVSQVYHNTSLPSGGGVWICMQKHSKTKMLLLCVYPVF